MKDSAISHFRTLLESYFGAGWKELMRYDEYSTREYMKFVNPKYSDRLMNYLETFTSALNLYDCAPTETVIDSLDFEYCTNVK
ncbi:hypothetical protein SCP_0601370 [Sparassis crispa]|uniref:Uncharacterized protein n=1 Tax=Sparassis crispa TaxID=139825 RepID=A0A401GPT1_9APHY|nr:hypothetical protein SCP_0601370 [Sparassis crispa]GBE84159.1 hypothetical protein SCP_0601370 [Sparassis crispa]